MRKKNSPLLLVVDDSPINVKLLTQMLLKKGYRVDAVQNGESAIKYLNKKQPDIILLDVIMPKCDGIDTCRGIKKIESVKNIPVIFITALTDKESRLKGFDAGGVDYITRPFIVEEVLARIKVHIELKTALEKLEQRSLTDELTGIYNRRFAYKTLERQISLARREKQSFVICYIDIDNLKKVNDAHGHSTGDNLIITVVDTLKKNIRKTDYIFRMGGDEFLLLFPNSQMAESDNLIKRIRKKLRGRKIRGVPIDFSFGFSEFSHNEDKRPDDLINNADRVMYREKKLKMKA